MTRTPVLTAMKRTRRSQVTGLAAVMLALVVVRFGVLWLDRRSVWEWRSRHADLSTLLLLCLLALIVAPIASLVVRRWFGPIVVVMVGIVAGAVATSVLIALPGAFLGLVSSAPVASPSLRHWYANVLVRPCVHFLPWVGLGIAGGYLASWVMYVVDPRWRVPVLLGVAAGTAVTAWGWIRMVRSWKRRRAQGLAMRSLQVKSSYVASPNDASTSHGCAIATGAMSRNWAGIIYVSASCCAIVMLSCGSYAVGLWGGVQLSAWQRLAALRAAGHTSVTVVPTRGVEMLWRPIFRIQYASLVEPATDRDLANLSDVSELLGLYLESPRITNRGLVRLTGVQKLRSLHIENVPVGDTGLQPLLGPALMEVGIRGTHITDRSLVRLARLPALTYLRLQDNRIDGEGVAALGQAGTLQLLHLDGIPVDDEDLGHLAKLTSLTDLSLQGTRVRGPGLAQLAQGARSLNSLVLSDTPLDASHLRQLVSLPLQMLELDGIPLDTSAVAYIAKMPSLTHLYLRRTGITDEALAYLSGKNLMYLALDASRLTRAGMEKLGSAAARDVALYVDDATIEPADVRRLSECMDTVRLVNCTITDAAAEVMASIQRPEAFLLLSPALSQRALQFVRSNPAAVRITPQPGETAAP